MIRLVPGSTAGVKQDEEEKSFFLTLQIDLALSNNTWVVFTQLFGWKNGRVFVIHFYDLLMKSFELGEAICDDPLSEQCLYQHVVDLYQVVKHI